MKGNFIMKKCPKCGEVVGNNADSCFKCGEKFHDDISDVKKKMLVSELNDFYEYDVVSVVDTSSGRVDVEKLIMVLSYYANEGWRLKCALTNEAGKNSSMVGTGGISYGTNATIDDTILIFERRIESAEDRTEKLKDKYKVLIKKIELENEERRKVAEEKKAGSLGVEQKLYDLIKKSDTPLDITEINEKLNDVYSAMDVLTYLQRLVDKGQVQRVDNKYVVE